MTPSERQAEVTWSDDTHVEVDGVRFLTTGPDSSDPEIELKKLQLVGGETSRPDRFVLLKSRPLVEHYVDLLTDDTRASRNIFELGIFKGGSVAFLDLLARPDKLVAVDLSPQPVEALTDHLAVRGRNDHVKAYYGVDQADRGRLEAILDAEFDDQPLDLVLDDASHRRNETRTSFNILFPRLGPGGCYIIEDWCGIPDPEQPPLVVFVFELLLGLVANGRQVIDDISIDANVVTIRRGTGALPGSQFDISATYDQQWSYLLSDVPAEG